MTNSCLATLVQIRSCVIKVKDSNSGMPLHHFTARSFPSMLMIRQKAFYTCLCERFYRYNDSTADNNCFFVSSARALIRSISKVTNSLFFKTGFPSINTVSTSMLLAL